MNTLKPDTRCYGVDLLKTVSMFLVVILHLLGHGGIIWNAAVKGTALYNVAWLMECFALCAVNCFAIASGYLTVGKTVKYRKLIPMWLTVTLYSVLSLVVGMLMLPGSVTLKDWLFVFPVTTGKYWYFTAYVGLYLLLPFVNKFIESVSEKAFKTLLVVGFLMLSGSFLFSLGQDLFRVTGGYSVWWLLYLYLLGAGMKKYGLFTKIPLWAAGVGYVASVFLTLGGKLLTSFLIDRNIPRVSYFFSFFGDSRWEQYLSPSLLAAAIFLTVFCIKLKLPKVTHKPLKWLSPLIFQVYIIHETPWVRDNWIVGKTGYLASGSVLHMVLSILLGAVIIFVFCIAVDALRWWLFRLLQVDRWVNALADKVMTAFHRKS